MTMSVESMARKPKTELARTIIKLTDGLLVYIHKLDEIMNQPASSKKDGEVAKLSNALELMNDRVRLSMGADIMRENKDDLIKKILASPIT